MAMNGHDASSKPRAGSGALQSISAFFDFQIWKVLNVNECMYCMDRFIVGKKVPVHRLHEDGVHSWRGNSWHYSNFTTMGYTYMAILPYKEFV